MEAELKQVQEIYPEAKYVEWIKHIEVCMFWGIRFERNKFVLLHRGVNEKYYRRTDCKSKDFNKILGVLKAIKLCEED